MARERLAERRRELGLSQEDIAQDLGVDAGTYSRYERGLMTPRPALHRRLAEILQWEPAQLALALNDGQSPPNGQVVPEWLTLYASLEQGAARVSTWAPHTVHALLQTPGYAAAVESVGPVTTSAEAIARRVELRMSRQAVLWRQPDPLRLHVVLDESVLRRAAGGPEVMADQLQHLAEIGPSVDLRVLPLDAGVHAAAFGTFTLLSANGADDPFMAVAEDRTGHRYHEAPHAVDAHRLLFDHLLEHALPPDSSAKLIRFIANKEYR